MRALSGAGTDEARPPRLGPPLVLLLAVTGLWCVLAPLQQAHSIGRASGVAYGDRLAAYVPELLGAAFVVVALVLMALRRRLAIAGFVVGAVSLAVLEWVMGSPGDAWVVSCGLMGASAWRATVFFDHMDELALDAEARRALAPFQGPPTEPPFGLRVLDHEPNRWTLLRYGEALALDVNCGHEAAGYSVLIALDAKETARFKGEGRSVLDGLAETVVLSNPGHRDSDSVYLKRQLPAAFESAATAAVLAWRAGGGDRRGPGAYLH